MLRIADKLLNPRLVVFDKDGTLIAFEAMWHTWYAQFLEGLAAQAPLDEALRQGLAGTLGYDAQTDVWDPQGPLTIASTGEVALLVASQVYRYAHMTWEQALRIVACAQEHAREALRRLDLVQPVGDVRGLLQRMGDAGLLLALATTDDRRPTEQALGKLGLAPLLSAIVCGDDGIPLKPAPDMALEICRRLGVAPQEALMVGDTVADLLMARRAGFCQAVAVTSGAVPGALLAPHADLLIPDIHAIEVIPPEEKSSHHQDTKAQRKGHPGRPDRSS